MSEPSLLSRASFLCGAASLSGMPPDVGAEVAFAGRSNAGKSSAVNVITSLGALARTSKTPGRTQQINFFGLDEERRLVDLPGYGYAQVPVPVRQRWERTTANYLARRRCLRGVVLMMDVRHPLTDADRSFVQWCRAAALPLHVLLTKADKLGRGRGSAALAGVRAELVEASTVQLFSAPTRLGVDEARARILAWLDASPVSPGKKIPG